MYSLKPAEWDYSFYSLSQLLPLSWCQTLGCTCPRDAMSHAKLPGHAIVGLRAAACCSAWRPLSGLPASPACARSGIPDGYTQPPTEQRASATLGYLLHIAHSCCAAAAGCLRNCTAVESAALPLLCSATAAAQQCCCMRPMQGCC